MNSSGKNILNLIYMVAIILIILLNLSPTTCYDELQLPYRGKDKIKSNNNDYKIALSEAISNIERNALSESENKRRKFLQKDSENDNFINNKNVELIQLALKLKKLQENNEDNKFKYENNNLIPTDDLIISEENKLDYSDEIDEYDDIQNVKRNSFQPHITYQSLCRWERRKVVLQSHEYQYKPSFYHEIICNYSSDENGKSDNQDKEVCSGFGFHCIQLNRTLHFNKKRVGHDCWETESIFILDGCECKWPKHSYGDINNIP